MALDLGCLFFVRREKQLSTLVDILSQHEIIICSNILRGLATIEADVSSHAEAVLHGRLSKIAQEKINLAAEQHQQQLLQEITADNVLGGGCSASTDMVNESPDANGDIEVKGGRHHFVGDLRRKLRKAIR